MALTLGDNFSYQGAKPLDARLVYSTVASMKAVADSTMYDGCMAYCTATDKTYQWKSTNAVDETTGKWREFTSGGDTIQVSSMPTASASELGKVYQYIGSTTLAYTHGYFYECVSDGAGTPTYSWEEVSTSKGGHDIKNDGVAVTSRDTMNFTDFDIADDSTNEETDIKAHRLTQAEMSEIMSTLPGTPTELPVMFDETGAEYVVGWYKTANGKKPVYQKTVDFGSLPNNDKKTVTLTGMTTSLIDQFVGIKATARYLIDSGGIFDIAYRELSFATSTLTIGIWIDNNKTTGLFQLNIRTSSDQTATTAKVTIQYTKTTDTPV